eukprot:symbB.v1.2.003159.t1/scaffold173.1/size339812/2
MLQNTRERTVFAFQPKRLPKDVDRLRFFQGSIVRKKSVGTRGDTDDEEEEAAKASELPEQPARVFRSASVNDLRTTVRKQRESGESEGIEGRSAKDPSPRRLHACVSMSSLPSARRSEVPPPLPAFPGAWKIQASVAGSQNDRASSAREVKPPSGQKAAEAAAGKASLTCRCLCCTCEVSLREIIGALGSSAGRTPAFPKRWHASITFHAIAAKAICPARKAEAKASKGL